MVWCSLGSDVDSVPFYCSFMVKRLELESKAVDLLANLPYPTLPTLPVSQSLGSDGKNKITDASSRNVLLLNGLCA